VATNERVKCLSVPIFIGTITLCHFWSGIIVNKKIVMIGGQFCKNSTDAMILRLILWKSVFCSQQGSTPRAGAFVVV
jgi:hypothetical protein